MKVPELSRMVINHIEKAGLKGFLFFDRDIAKVRIELKEKPGTKIGSFNLSPWRDKEKIDDEELKRAVVGAIKEAIKEPVCR